MKTLILCGGQGTRLREETEYRPKPMVSIGGRPILWHIMKLYAHHGHQDFVLCLGYKGEYIKRYFLNYEAMNSDFTIDLGSSGAVEYHNPGHDESGWRVTLCETGEKAMTGSRIMRASKYLDGDTFAVTYGDGVSNVDLSSALEFHRSHGKTATLTGVRTPSRFGELDVRGSAVAAFQEKATHCPGIINGGFFFFEPRFLDYLSEEDGCILEQGPLQRCAADGELEVFRHEGFWQCMDTYREWQDLEQRWLGGNAPWKVWS
jgi:glucose-1-phosphate cytidylyltransferase